MPDLPAVCNSCKLVFRSGFVVEGAAHVEMAGNMAGPCPRCGGMGQIPDGLYTVVGDTINILARAGRSVSQLERLKSLLQEAQAQSSSPETIRRKVAEEVPELKGIADLLPQTRQDVYSLIGIILAALALMISLLKKDPATEININQVFNHIYQQQITFNSDPPPMAPGHSAAPKIGRNAPCHCGSGKKFKYCHGQ